MPEHTPDGDKHAELHIGLTPADLAELNAAPPAPSETDSITPGGPRKGALEGPEFPFQRPSNVRFEDAALQKLEAEIDSENYPPRRRELLEAHGITINPALAPNDLVLERFTDQDWANVQSSETQFLTLLAAGNYHTQDARTTFVPASSRRPAHPDPREGYQGLENQARIETLPLIHGMTAEAFVELARTGTMQSNKTRLEQADAGERPQFHSTSVGTYSDDREFGLDQYVFFDFARPAHNHTVQPEITLVVDPAVMNQPGTFMTSRDMQDIPPDSKQMQSYLNGATTPEYFHKTALLQIHNTVTASGESRSGGGAGRTGWNHYNTLGQFMAGQDGEPILGMPAFSTYEVKIPDPPGVPTESIRRVIVRDQATFDQLQQTMGDRFEFIHAQTRQRGGIKPDYEGDARDPAAIDPGNYAELFQIPGTFEQRMETLIENDFRERTDALAALPDNDKEQAVVVFARTDPEKIDGPDVQTRLTSHTNPYRFNEQTVVTYPSLDALQADVRDTTRAGLLDNLNTAQNKPAWFFNWASGERNPGSCVIATVERSKQDPRLTRILNLKPFSLDQQAA